MLPVKTDQTICERRSKSAAQVALARSAGRFTVTCIKTKHHEGRELRLVPIFPELRPYLEKWRQQAPEDAKWGIGRSRSGKAYLRTQMLRILKRASIVYWPKLFLNLRSSRETELMAVYPAHVVCAWLGNTPKVAMKHYLQVTEEDYRKASESPTDRQAG